MVSLAKLVRQQRQGMRIQRIGKCFRKQAAVSISRVYVGTAGQLIVIGHEKWRNCMLRKKGNVCTLENEGTSEVVWR